MYGFDAPLHTHYADLRWRVTHLICYSTLLIRGTLRPVCLPLPLRTRLRRHRVFVVDVAGRLVPRLQHTFTFAPGCYRCYSHTFTCRTGVTRTVTPRLHVPLPAITYPVVIPRYVRSHCAVTPLPWLL